MFEKFKKLFSKKTKVQEVKLESTLNPENIIPENSTQISKPVQNFQIPNIQSQSQGVSPESQKKLLIQRRKIPIYVLILKFVSLIFVMLTIISWVALYADLNPENSLLKWFGLSENTQMNYLKETKKQDNLKKENETYSKKIAEYQRRLNEEDYFIYEKITNDIRANQFRWFNESVDGETLIGIIDSIGLIKKYISQSDYQNQKKYPINFILNNVKFDSKSFNRKNLSVAIKASNVSQNTLTLSTEITEIFNSFPFFKGGNLSTFSRKENKDGEIESSFSLKLEIQGKNEKDPSDERYKEFDDWFKLGKMTEKTEKKGPSRK